MRREDFRYTLPPGLIAQHPPATRGLSRLLCLDRRNGSLTDRNFQDFPHLLHPHDLLVFNDTRVLPARLFGRKDTGGKVEILVERLVDEHRFTAQVRSSKPPRADSRIILGQGIELSVLARNGDMYTLEISGTRRVLPMLEELGHVPLPPYIQRDDTASDRERYQTVYARHPGAVAAPTAGLHFTEDLLRAISARNIRTAFLTLHVGAGTFQPLRAARLEDNRIHSERLTVSPELCAEAEAARKRGGRIIAVGTTVVRGLETAGRSGVLEPYAGETEIFIYPGFEFKIIDALLTNFHLPESTLLMLVCAFAGTDRVLRAYRHAVEHKYRFYSYGDAMFINIGEA